MLPRKELKSLVVQADERKPVGMVVPTSKAFPLWACLGVVLLVLMPPFFGKDDLAPSSGDAAFSMAKSSILCEAKERKRKAEAPIHEAGTSYSKTNPGISFKPLNQQQLMVDTRALPPAIPYWDVLGPFPVGKTEYDGDPIEAYGGIYNLSRPSAEGSPSTAQFLSEFATGGYVSWSRFVPNEEGWVEMAFPDVQWQFLVTSMNSITVLEFQAWAVADFYVHSSKSLFNSYVL